MIFNGEYLDIYIPRKSFKNNLASYNGEFIHTIGIFLFSIKNEEDLLDENREQVYHKMMLPNSIDFQYTDQFKFTGSINGLPSDTYEVFRLENGNQFVANVLLQKDSNEVIRFVKALHNGYIPSIVPYDKIITLYLDVLAINSVSLKAPSVIYELIISEACRKKGDMASAFRYALNKNPDIGLNNYTNIRINKIPAINSTFTGLTFEDMNNSIMTSLERTATGKQEKESPLEKSIKY